MYIYPTADTSQSASWEFGHNPIVVQCIMVYVLHCASRHDCAHLWKSWYNDVVMVNRGLFWVFLHLIKHYIRDILADRNANKDRVQSWSCCLLCHVRFFLCQSDPSDHIVLEDSILKYLKMCVFLRLLLVEVIVLLEHSGSNQKSLHTHSWTIKHLFASLFASPFPRCFTLLKRCMQLNWTFCQKGVKLIGC